MGNLSIVVERLKKEQRRMQKVAQRIDAALSALGSIGPNGSSRQRTLSSAARRKISLAQKARWAKQKSIVQPARPNRTLSAAGRKRIAAAQRARWAKVKRQKKAAA